MDPPKKVPPDPFSTVENGPSGPLFAVENGPPCVKWTPRVHFSPLKMDPPRKVRNIANVTPGPFSLCKLDPPVHFSALKMDPRSIFTRWKWTTGSLFAVVNGPPWSTFSRGKWTPLGKLRILQTLPPVSFPLCKMDPRSNVGV